MSRIKGRNTGPELVLRKLVFRAGHRYRIHAKIEGKPDIVFPGRKLAVFINGCFWHRHKGCKDFVWPKTNAEFWKKKIESNVRRDREVYEKLKRNGWKVIVVWECRINRNPEEALEYVKKELA